MRFSIRDLILMTVAIALATAWMVDRSQLAWRYDKVVGANERLREMLDNSDPGWRNKKDDSRMITRFDRDPNPTAACATAAVFLGLAVLLIVLAAKGKVDWSLVKRS